MSGDHRTVTLKLNAPLQANTAYEFAITGVEDLSGNALVADHTVTFTTGAGVDLSAPTLVSRTPVSNATGVPLNTLIKTTFSERINPLTVNDSSVRLYEYATGQFVAGTPSLSADGLTVQFTPDAPLTANHQYYFYNTYSTYIEDLAGNRYNAGSSFTTGDTAHTIAPQIVLSSVSDGATGIPVNGHLVFQFDTPLGDQCVNSQTVIVSAGGVPVAGSLSLSGDRTQLTFAPQDLLSTDTTYTATLDGLCDLAGNILNGVSSSFTTSSVATADTSGPTVTV